MLIHDTACTEPNDDCADDTGAAIAITEYAPELAGAVSGLAEILNRLAFEARRLKQVDTEILKS